MCLVPPKKLTQKIDTNFGTRRKVESVSAVSSWESDREKKEP